MLVQRWKDVYYKITKVQLLPTGGGCTFIASLQTTL